MTDKPLDCVGTTGPVGKHDWKAGEGAAGIRWTDWKPFPAAERKEAVELMAAAIDRVGVGMGWHDKAELVNVDECAEAALNALLTRFSVVPKERADA